MTIGTQRILQVTVLYYLAFVKFFGLNNHRFFFHSVVFALYKEVDAMELQLEDESIDNINRYLLSSCFFFILC